MASIFYDKLELQIHYRDFIDEWIDYDFVFLWDGKPVVSDAVLNNHSEWYRLRRPGGFVANEILSRDDGCHVLEFFDRFIASLEPDMMGTTEWDFDIFLSLPPSRLYAGIKRFEVKYPKSDAQIEYEKRVEDERAAAGGLLDSDVVELIVRFPTEQFEGGSRTSGGLALHLWPEWAEFRRFVEELRAEYQAFSTLHQIGVDEDDL